MRIAKEVALYNQGGIQNGIDDAESRASKVATSFITRVSAAEGIKVHNADDTTDYIQINSNGVDLVNDGLSIANFGESARIGKTASSRFVMGADSLEAYDDNNDKYFEVSPSGMTYGVHTVADTTYADGKASAAQSAAISTAASDATSKANAAQAAAEATAAADATSKANAAKSSAISTAAADATSKANAAQAAAEATAAADATTKANAAAKTATNYMYFNSSTGLDIASATPSTATRKVNISADGIKIQNDANNHADVTSSGLKVYQGGNDVAEFGSSARIGKSDDGHVLVKPTGLSLLLANASNLVSEYAYIGKGTSGFNPHFTFGFRDSGDKGNYSFVANFLNLAKGLASAAFGWGTIAAGQSQMAVGSWNVEDTSSKFIVGVGSSDGNRVNGLQIDGNGNAHIKGKVYTNCNDDSSGGTMPVLKVTKLSVSSLLTIITHSAITSSMEVINCVLSNPSAQTGDWTVTTSAGSLTISGSISGTTNITLYLAEPST